MKTHKYQQIKQHFIGQIQTHQLRGNQRIPSEKDLSAQWGVSPLTVGKALSQLEQEGYLIRKVGDGTYVRDEEELPRREMDKLGTENYIVMLINNMAYGFVPHLTHLVENRLSQLGYHIIIKNLNHSFEGTLRALRMLKQSSIRGFLFTPIYSSLYESDNQDLLKAIEALDRPVVMVNSYLRQSPCSFVVSDSTSGSYSAIKHLIDKGHRRIALLWNDRDSGTYDRMDGYKRALADHQIEFREEYVVRCRYSLAPAGESNPCRSTLNQLMQLPEPPTALFALDDYLGTYTQLFCEETGLRIPEDLAIVGFDDFLPSRLTVVRQNMDQIAEKTAELLLRYLSGETPEESRIFVPTQLIVREST
jgi:DNA-binding LacI/PurR family transcriptional regulator